MSTTVVVVTTCQDSAIEGQCWWCALLTIREYVVFAYLAETTRPTSTKCVGCRIQACEIEGNTATPCTCPTWAGA